MFTGADLGVVVFIKVRFCSLGATRDSRVRVFIDARLGVARVRVNSLGRAYGSSGRSRQCTR